MTAGRARPRLAPLLALVLVLGAESRAQDPPFGTTTTVQLPRAQELDAALLGDVDGDGRDDLVLTSHRRNARFERQLRVHLRAAAREVAFRAEPDVVVDVPDDAVACSVADVHPDAGREVVLFTPTSVWACRTSAPEQERFVKLLDAELLWQLPDSKELLAFEAGTPDLDGDGLPDLLVPGPDGYLVAFQRRGPAGASFAGPTVLLLGATEEGVEGAARLRTRSERKRLTISLTNGDGEAAPGDLVAVEEALPAPQAVDFDGDGRLDLVAQTELLLHVWIQRREGFAAEPDLELPLPLAADAGRRLDVSYSAHAEDVDGDGRADYVLFVGDRRSDSVRTQVLVFRHAQARSAGDPLPGLFTRDGPDDALLVAGFAGAPELVDVDGDGLRDLVVGSVRLDLFDSVKAASGGSVDAELLVFLNRRARFSPRPDLSHRAQLSAEGLRHVRREVTASFFGDVTGDRVRELLLRDEPTRLRVMLTRKGPDGLALHPRPLFEMRVAEDAVVAVHTPAGGVAELVVLEGSQLHHVRFR